MYEKHTWPTYTIAPILHVRKTHLAYIHNCPNSACTKNTFFVRKIQTKMEPGLPRVLPRLAPRGRPPIPPCRPRGETTHLVRKKRSAYGKFRLKYKQGTKTSRPEVCARGLIIFSQQNFPDLDIVRLMGISIIRIMIDILIQQDG